MTQAAEASSPDERNWTDDDKVQGGEAADHTTLTRALGFWRDPDAAWLRCSDDAITAAVEREVSPWLVLRYQAGESGAN